MTMTWAFLRVAATIALAAAALCGAAGPASGDAVVGSGSPASCTETALNDALASGGVIEFDCGGAATIVLSAVKIVAADTRLEGADRITLSGGTAVQLFRVEPGVRLELRGLILADGFAGREPGGAIRNLGELHLRETRLLANATLGFGGAIANEGDCEIVDSELVGNSAALGGGGIANFRRLAMSRSTVFANTAGYDPRVLGATEGPGSGGGIANYGSLTVANSTLSSNVAIPFRGGFFVAAFGGGLYNVGEATVLNCTLVRNMSEQSCGGIGNFGRMTAKNTLVAQSDGSDCCNYFGISERASVANLLETTRFGHSCGPSFAEVRREELRLGGLADNGGRTLTVVVQPGSAAVGAGDLESCAAALVDGEDQRGRPRLTLDDAMCDIGAYERVPEDPLPIPGATFLAMLGEQGDYVLGNQSRLFAESDGRFTAVHSPGSIDLRYDDDEVGIVWNVFVRAGGGRELSTGNYEVVSGDFDPSAPFLRVGGEGRGCGRSSGRFSIGEASYAIDGAIERLALDFEQHCEELQPALYGSLRINSNLPAASPRPGTPAPTATPVVATPTARPPLMPCVGDCALDGGVSIADIISGIRISVGLSPAAACNDADDTLDGIVAINELLLAVRSAIEGCR
jgi:hypothetical protein